MRPVLPIAASKPIYLVRKDWFWWHRLCVEIKSTKHPTLFIAPFVALYNKDWVDCLILRQNWHFSEQRVLIYLNFGSLTSLRHSGLEGVGLDLNLSPPPHPPCLLCPCLLWQVALLPPQEDQEPQPWGSDQDQAGGGRACYLYLSTRRETVALSS